MANNLKILVPLFGKLDRFITVHYFPQQTVTFMYKKCIYKLFIASAPVVGVRLGHKGLKGPNGLAYCLDVPGLGDTVSSKFNLNLIFKIF